MSENSKLLRGKQYREQSDTFNLISGTRTRFKVHAKGGGTRHITAENQIDANLIRTLLAAAGYQLQQ